MVMIYSSNIKAHDIAIFTQYSAIGFKANQLSRIEKNRQI